MKRLLFTLFAIWMTCGHADELDPILPLSNSDGHSAGLIEGCVSAITGDFLDAETDIVIPGTEPLTFSRTYNSSDFRGSELETSWFHNGYSFMCLRYVGYMGKEYSRIYYAESNGAAACFLALAKKNIVGKKHQFDTGYFENKGFTNCGRGAVSGRTSHRSTTIITEDKKLKNITVCSGNGSKKHFIRPFESVSPAWLEISNEERASGNRLHYHYDQYRQLGMSLTNSNGDQQFGALNFVRDYRSNPVFSVESSDGQKVTYRFWGRHDKKRTLYYLSSVERPHAPNVEYEYQKIHQTNYAKISMKKYPDNRFQQINYYLKGKHQIGKGYIRVDGPNDPIYGRVKELLAPVGTDATPIVTHRISYILSTKKKKKRPLKICKGITVVKNALNHRTDYVWDGKQRLTHICRYTGDGDYKSHTTEEMVWNKSQKDEGNLLERILYNGNYVPISRRKFSYDQNGNVVTDRFIGDITGNGSKDEYKISYNYTKDGFNLVNSEKKGNVTTLYRYKPGTDLLVAKLTTDRAGICTREFHEYNQNAALTETIIDDGNTEDRNSLNGVTTRFITRIQPKQTAPCLGFPEVVEEFAVDLESGAEILLKKYINAYNQQGQVTSQSIYDAENVHCYTLITEYDLNGNPTLEIDALGYQTKKTYDANGNLLTIAGPTPGLVTSHSYDYMNRLIRTEISDAEGNLWAQTCAYDYLSNKISETDCSGHKTCFSYDEFGQVIEEINPLNTIVTKKYDELGNVIQVVDGRGNATNMS